MSPTKDEMLAKAKERGYTVNAKSGDGNWYSLFHEEKEINCQLWVKEGRFEISFIEGMLTVTTNRCGSFMNDDHFKRLGRQVKRARRKI